MTRVPLLRPFLEFCVVVNLAATLLCARADAPEKGENVLLATFPADATSKFDLVIAPCTEAHSCPMLVRLLQGGKVLDSMPIEWPVADRNAVITALTAGDGVGDPVGALPSSKTTWVNGQEQFSVATAASSMRLSAGHSALLVTQSGGWDHPHYHHELFVAEGSKLRRVWTTEESHDITWSAVEISRGKDGADRIVRFTGFRNDFAEEADSVGVSLISWNRIRKEVVETQPEDASNSRQKVFLFVWGSYPTIAEAREAHVRSRCVNAYTWVVDAHSYGLPKGNFSLVTPSLFSALPAALKSSLKSCHPPISVSIVPYVAR